METATLRAAACNFSTAPARSCMNASSSSFYSGSASLTAVVSRRQHHVPAEAHHLVVEAKEATRREKIKVRHMRIRRKLNGTAERPRLAVFRSNKHMYAQVIDDSQQHTLAAASTLTPSLREELKLTAGPTVEASRRVGVEIAKICLDKGITKVAFDRGGFIYHGRIQAVADGAREGGLEL